MYNQMMGSNTDDGQFSSYLYEKERPMKPLAPFMEARPVMDGRQGGRPQEDKEYHVNVRKIGGAQNWSTVLAGQVGGEALRSGPARMNVHIWISEYGYP